jgi:hypothetical protein
MPVAVELLVGCLIVILTLKRCEFAIFLLILSSTLSAIFAHNSLIGIDADDGPSALNCF